MWIIFFALPDLNLNESVGNENISIVPHDDSKIAKIIERNPYAKALVDSFEDQFGQKKYPSLMIINETAPQHIRDIDALVGFRNIFALSIIIEGYEHSLNSEFVAYPLYSDYFDFYPIAISKDNDGFLTQSPSILGFDDRKQEFRGQTSPSLAGPDHIRASSANDLFGMLQKIWKRRYLRKRYNEWSTRTLFRSLEMAYQASSMPFKNHSTIYDYGSSTSLWVSAFEILSHPRKGNANLQSVLSLLGNYDWADRIIRKRIYKVKHWKKSHPVNLAQKLYKELYDTRNGFLHGNPVNQNRLRPFKNKNAPAITSFAPLLYKVALLAFLKKYQGKKRRKDLQKEYMTKLLNEKKLVGGLLKSKNK